MKTLYYDPAYFSPPYLKPSVPLRCDYRSVKTYATTSGDTFQDLLTRYNLSPDLLLQLNPDLVLAPNQTIYLV